MGVAIQSTLPRVLADFIPFTFQFHTAWLAVGRAMAIGFVICLLFALVPLLTVRRVSPLAALRASFEPVRARRDPLRWLVGSCIAGVVSGFALMQARNWRVGLGFAGGLGMAFGILDCHREGAGLAGAAIRPGRAAFHGCGRGSPTCTARTTARCRSCCRSGWEPFS